MANTQINEIWSDIDHRFTTDAQGQLKKVINIKSVETSLDNILRTRKGERLMLPEFGLGLDSLVFENMNSTMMDYVSRNIKNEVERWDNRILITQVKFLEYPDNNSIYIEISYAIKGYSQIFQYKSPISGQL